MKKLDDVKTRIVSFGFILGEFVRVLIPSFQREYRWTIKQVRKFVVDAKKMLIDQESMIFFGGATAYGESDFTSTTLNVVDGQQRITTAYLTLCAGRRRLAGLPDHADLLNVIDDCLFTTSKQGVVSYRLVSQHAEANSVIGRIVSGEDVSCEGLKRPALNYASAFAAIVEELGRLLPEEADLAVFLQRLLEEAGVSMVMADESYATSIFVSQHTTQTPLDIVDQMKGILFNSAHTKVYPALVTAIHIVQGIFWDMEGPADRHFHHILRGLFPNQGKSAPTLLEKASKASATSPLSWVTDTLLPAARALSQGILGNHPDGSECPPLKDIKEIKRLSRFRGIRPIMVAARNLTKADRDTLMTSLRDTLIVLAVSKNHPPDNEVFFANCAELVASDGLTAALASMQSHRDSLAQDFSTMFHALDEADFGRNGMRMLLNASECAVRNELGLTVPASLYSMHSSESYDVEHILPQSPGAWSSWPGVANPAAAHRRLGNLAILEKTHNSSIKDAPFSAKRLVYGVADCFVTKSISTSFAGQGVANKAAKANALLSQFATWDDAAIEQRTALLYVLVCKHLGIRQEKPAVVLPASPRDYSQGRRPNSLRMLRAIAQGSTTKSEIEEHLDGRTDDRERQVGYCASTLEFLGLVERLGDDEFALTDDGDVIAKLPKDAQEAALRVRFEEAVRMLPSGQQLIEVCLAPRSSTQERILAVEAVYVGMAKTMAEHRAASAKTWLAPPSVSLGTNSSLQQEPSLFD